MTINKKISCNRSGYVITREMVQDKWLMINGTQPVESKSTIPKSRLLNPQRTNNARHV